jgi:enoyl-CoA hydratase/carnithine racemase
MVELERRGKVFVLTLNAGENRFSPDVVDGINQKLDEVEKADGPKALVTTGSGKFFSNGLDLAYMMGEGKDRAGESLASVLALIRRVLIFPCITVSAVNGHAFGAGAQIAVAHDIRFMRADRGFFCMPEIDMRTPLHPGMTAILKARLPGHTVHEVLVTGTRYGGEAAAANGIVDHACAEAELLPRALAAAAALAGKADPAMSTIKQDLHAEAVAALALPLGALSG